MLPFKEAYQQILSQINLLPYENVYLIEAVNRVLRENIYAPHDLPPFALSAMDGYAVIAEDVKSASESSPVTLEIVEILPAGKVSTQAITKGHTARIFTGAPIPRGADAVVMQEVTEQNDSEVIIKKSAIVQENIRPAGEDVKKGELVMEEGKTLRPGEVEILGAMGISKVKVGRKPKVAIIPTGDEILNIEDDLSPGKVRNGNQYAVAAAVMRCGGKLILSKIVKDNEEDLENRIRDCIDSGVDLILTIGGVSVGDFDITKKVFSKMGDIKLWRIAIQPGKPLAFGFIQGIPVIGLPGFPVSCLVTFEQFVRPALWKMQGKKDLERPTAKAVLEEPLKRQAGRLAFYRGIAEKDENGVYHVRTTGSQGSGVMSSLVKANVFIEIPAECTELKKGDTVTIQFPSILEE